MRAFLPTGIRNINESPLASFADQSKAFISDMDTPNDIDRRISSKGFAAVILTVFGDDDTQVDPVLLYKKNAYESIAEDAQYVKDGHRLLHYKLSTTVLQ